MGSLPFRGTAHEAEYGTSMEPGLAWEFLQRVTGPGRVQFAASQRCNQPFGKQRFPTGPNTTKLMDEFVRPTSAERAKLYGAS